MQSMPPLEHPNQLIESKHDTQTLANKDAFEISPCPNYEETIHDFVHKIVSNNKCRETFYQTIQCVNPLSRSTAIVFAKLVQNKADMITVRGWNVIKSSSNIDETTIICYLIEYAHYARALSKSTDKPNKSNDGFRKKIFDKLNNDARLKLKLNALSLDVLSLIITCHFISSLSSVTDGFFRSLLSTYLPSYLMRFTMNGTHFIRLFDSVVYHSKHCEETTLLQQLFDCVAQHIEFASDGHISARHTSSLRYDHLFDIDVIFYILKQMMSITLTLPPSVEIFIIHLTTYAMNKFVMTPSHTTTQTKQIDAEFICLMLNVYHQYSSKLPSHYCTLLYDLCRDLFKHAGDDDGDDALNICLLSDMICALVKINHLNQFITFIAEDKQEHVNRIFEKEIIKKSGIVVINQMITSASSKNKNIDWLFNDEQFINIKSAFVRITVEIAKQYTQQGQETTTLLSTCAKSMIKFDDKSKNLKRNSIFTSNEFEKLIWCFGFAKYRNHMFWKELYAKVKKLSSSEINSDIITKFSWSIARVKSYLSKHNKDNLIHAPMIWCIKNCVELVSNANQSIATLFTLEQLSTICWAISICGKPGTHTIENNYNDRALKYYVKLFDHIVSNTWEIVDFTLTGKPQFYINILTAMLTYKDELLMEDEVKKKVIEFVIHVLNQFNISERGETYMKSDPNLIDFLLHIAAEFRIHVHVLDNSNNINNSNNSTSIPAQMIKQINKMLLYLMDLHVDISAETAFSIACTLSRIPYNEQLIGTKHKVLNFLCNLIIKESHKRSHDKSAIPLEFLLGLCSAICTHSSVDNPMQWDPLVIDILLKSAKHYLYDKRDRWSDNHFLLKNHLKYFLDKFDKS
eukprot:35230_1